ncbi:hypothetical protein RJ639_046121 [Escallonia herrerae]|uniref:Glabrous enhancer-binding protein-like DBD domain-containing protein n=1 Tax=Escallonia herrerae TaxID=1293975 RepID=A0AA88W615_9ASTE|nr:hypothetical protein RJ639_046121 [Escallonia herrerae]
MPSEEDPTAIYGADEDLEDDDDDDDVSSPHDEDEDVDVDDDDSTSSSNLAPGEHPPPSAVNEVTIAVAGDPPSSVPDPKRQRIDDVTIAAVVEEKKPLPLDESRRLFQRLWTDEDEIELLQGFLDYTAQRGITGSSHHHDTTAFYDQIKCKLQLDFNKNQLVEKLRRLKKKYRNVLGKMSTGKEYVFKTPHDKSTFDISCKIWGGACGGSSIAVAAMEDGGLDDDDGNANPNPNPNPSLIDHGVNNGVESTSLEKKVSRSRKRSRVKVEDIKPTYVLKPPQSEVATVAGATGGSISSLVEETVRSCLSPFFKELLSNAVNGPYGGSRAGFGGVTLNPVPLSFGGFVGGGDSVDGKWRKQEMLELEVYSKRLELVQDQIKARLEELRSMGS